MSAPDDRMTQGEREDPDQAQAYAASPVKRRRATHDEMAERAEFFIAYAMAHAPVTVRGLYYQAEVAGLPGIDKTELGYAKVQRQVLDLRRQGRLPYGCIADGTRWVRRARTFDSIDDALRETASVYRKALWRGTDSAVEVWCEKDALAGVISPVTMEYDVKLMVTRGFTSETFAYEAIEDYEGTGRDLFVIALYDFDRSGHDASRSLREKLERFGVEKGVGVYFIHLALTEQQARDWSLPTRPPKRQTAADKRWPHDFACELDAIPPDTLRELVRNAIDEFLPADELRRLKAIEAEERSSFRRFAETWRAA